MIINLDLDIEDLEIFFKENKDENVGERGSECACPISIYFWRKRNLDVAVGAMRIAIAGTNIGRPLEEWEKTFVDKFDAGTYECPDGAYGSEALEVLEK